jgi:hypothetical protein
MGKCTEAVLDVGQVCPELAARRVNFFSGRLLAADDLRQEQSALSQRDRWLGGAIGAGVARGLQVTRVAEGKGFAANLLQVAAGLAINACGEALALDKPLRLRLAPAVEKSGAGGFAPCGSEAGFVMDQGEGYYLISLAPAIGLSSEKAQEIGHNGQLIACGARWRLEGISLQADRIPAAALPVALRSAPPLANTPALSLARSLLARHCLGEVMGVTPLDVPAADLLHSARLAQPERVPLALVAWTDAGIAFVDRWAVRRSPAPETSNPSGFPYWPPGANRAMQAEAMQRQFQEHLAEVLQAGAANAAINAAGMAAGDWFLWLPSVGILTRQNSELGLSAKAFFAGLPTRALFLARAALEKLLRDGMAYPPIDLTLKAQELIWLYQLVEDRGVRIFASGHLPPANPARFDLARYNAALFPDGEAGIAAAEIN